MIASSREGTWIMSRPANSSFSFWTLPKPQTRANVRNDQTWWSRGLRDELRFTELVRSRQST